MHSLVEVDGVRPSLFPLNSETVHSSSTTSTVGNVDSSLRSSSVSTSQATMDASLRPEYIASSELATALRHPTEPRPIVVDVRDVDFAGGHIRTAINVPEWKFNDDANVDDLVERYKDEKQLVFHCMLSQVRGPKCAKRFLTRLQAVVKEIAPRPVVQVLVGGYARFSELYKGETDLLED